ncbi:MAG: tail fiber domain-containing protein [Bacteroidota bacterium]
MKTKGTFFIVLLLTGSFYFGTANRVEAQCNISANAITCPGFVTGQEESSFGQFTGSEEWSALGRAPFPANNGDFPYGLRLQRLNTTALFQLKRRTNSALENTPVDANVFWGNVQSSPPGPFFPVQELPRMDFDYIFQDQTAVPPTLSNTNVMTLTANSTKLVSANPNSLALGCEGTVACFGRVGIERTNPTYTLDVNGVARVSDILISSDARYKNNVQTIENGIEVIRQLRGATYNLQDEAVNGMYLDGGEKAGFIAQEVEDVLPLAVFTDEQGYKSVNYIAVIPYLVEGVKELTGVVDNLNGVVEDLNGVVANLEGENDALRAELEAIRNQVEGTGSTKGASAIGTTRAAQLFQNIPNPFDQETQINYFLPKTVQSATMLVFDMNGRQVRSFDVTTNGQGSVTIRGTELEAGMYIYSLIADGQEIDSKRMILTK